MADDDAPGTTLDSIGTAIAVSLGTIADEMMELSAATSALIRRDEQERSRVQQFIDHFAVGSILADHAVDRGTREIVGTQVNHRVVRRDLDALNESISQGQLLHGRLLASHYLMRQLRSAFDDGDWNAEIGSTGDVRIQQATLAAREDERGRLAREIHDGPAQVFANAIFALDIAEQVAHRDPALIPDELSQLRALLKEGVTEMRRFMTDLRPAMLTDRGLVPTLHRYVIDYNRFFGKVITFTATDVPETLSSEQQLALFRIVQEGLQNIQKHAETQHGVITISPDTGDDMLVLTITDEGQGFDASSLALGSGQGAGLAGIRERVRLIGADLDVQSTPGAGTTVRVALPLPTRDPSSTTSQPSSGSST